MHSEPENRRSHRPVPVDEAARRAAEWKVRRDRGLSAAEERGLEEWRAADPRNAAEFARIDRVWRALDGIGAVSDLAAEADTVVARARRGWPGSAWVMWSSVLLAAAASVALFFALWRSRSATQAPTTISPVAKNYVVVESTARLSALSDGSAVKLNRDSRIETDFTPAARRVRLVRGEAHFSVAKDPARPFIVTVGTCTVRAVGTAFDIHIVPNAVVVVVTEGKVGVGEGSRLQTLAAGERAILRKTAGEGVSTTIDRPVPAEIDSALAWEYLRLDFDNTPLDQVVAAFNHYNSRQLTLADPSLRNRTLTGIFRADNLDGFVRLLRASVDVVAVPRGDRILLCPAP